MNGTARAARRKQQHEALRRTSKAAAIKAKRQRKRALTYVAGLLDVILIGLIVIVVTYGGGNEEAEEELADPGVPSSSITFIGTDFSYRPAVIRGIADPIELTFKNEGPAGHDLAIVREGVRLSSWDQANEENLVGKISFTDKQAETIRPFDSARALSSPMPHPRPSRGGDDRRTDRGVALVGFSRPRCCPLLIRTADERISFCPW